MPSAYTARLKLEKQASGENSGTWGDLVNYTFNRLDASIEGWQAVNVAGSANVTLTSNNATTNNAIYVGSTKELQELVNQSRSASRRIEHDDIIDVEVEENGN